MTEIQRTPLRLAGAEGEPIRGWIHAAAGAEAVTGPIVVFVHGFKGFQDWGPWASICDRIAQAGYDAVRFDLSHNGVGDDGVDFSALHLFGRNTISMELFDLGVVLEALPVPRKPRPLILFGHSRGAADVIVAGGWLLWNLYPLETRDRFSLAGVVAWAPIESYFRSWPDEFHAAWAAGECGEIPNARTGQMMPLGPGMQRDLDENSARLSVYQGARALGAAKVPLLVVHGTKDEAVPIEEGQRICAEYRAESAIHALRGEGTCRWVPVEGAGHTFGAAHPFTGWNPALEAAFASTLDFIRFATP